jgi:hypothetical protein
MLRRSLYFVVSLVGCGREPTEPAADRIAALEARVAALEKAKDTETLAVAIDRSWHPPAEPVALTGESGSTMTISLSSAGLSVDGKRMAVDALGETLREAQSRDRTLRVIVEATPEVPYAEIVRVMDQVRSVNGSVALAVRRAGGGEDIDPAIAPD